MHQVTPFHAQKFAHISPSIAQPASSINGWVNCEFDVCDLMMIDYMQFDLLCVRLWLNVDCANECKDVCPTWSVRIREIVGVLSKVIESALSLVCLSGIYLLSLLSFINPDQVIRCSDWNCSTDICNGLYFYLHWSWVIFVVYFANGCRISITFEV
jgi:hypothetical protein